MLGSLWPTLVDAPRHELVLVDDGSTADTRSWLQGVAASRAGVRVLFHERNQGYAAAVMTGLQQARGARIGLLNSDLLFQPGWLGPMLQALGPPTAGVGIVGNLQYRVNDGSLDHAGVVLSPAGQFGHLQQPPQAARTQALAVTGACVLLHREAFERVGGLDTGYRNGCEDIDLCLKLRRAGLRVVVAQTSAVRHHVSLSRGRAPDQNEANSRRLFRRWRPEIRRELTTVWQRLLAGGRPDAGQPWMAGELTAEALAAPNAMAGLLAEQALRRQEARWAEMLGPDSGAVADGGVLRWPYETPPRLLSTTGLGWPRADGARPLRDQAVIHFTAPMHARNLYVCGRVTPVRPGADTAEGTAGRLLIELNSVQRTQPELPPSGALNLGLASPLVLPGQRNTLVLRRDPAGAGLGDEVLLTHLVIDDRVLGWAGR